MQRVAECKQGRSMSYIESNLLDDEHLVHQAHLHWIIFIKAIFWLIIAILIYLLVPPLYYSPTGAAPIPIHKIALLIPIIFTLTYAMGAQIRYRTSEFGITDKRIMIKLGFLRRYTFENFLQKVESIQVYQSLLGRILNYGSIIIHGTGGSREVYALLNDPLLFRKMAQEQIEKVL